MLLAGLTVGMYRGLHMSALPLIEALSTSGSFDGCISINRFWILYREQVIFHRLRVLAIAHALIHQVIS